MGDKDKPDGVDVPTPAGSGGGSSTPGSSADFSNADIAGLLKSLTATVEKFATDQSSGSTSSKQPPAKRRRPAEDESDDGEKEPEPIEASKTKTFGVSEVTKSFLEACFSLPRPASNKARSAWLTHFGLPEGDETRCPKLDSIIKQELPKEAIEADRKLSRLQNFVLDAAGPLAAAHEELVNVEEPDLDLVQQAVELALRILGNTSAQFSQERRLKAIGRLNSDLKSLVEDEDFSKSGLLLFGAGFEKKAKERSEAVKCLRKATFASKKGESFSSSSSSRKFFRGSRSQWRGSGSGRGSGSYNNYRSQQDQYKKKSLPPKNGTERRPSGQ